MAELADALDSGRVTSVTTSNLESAPPSERSLRVKMDDPTSYAGMAELADALDSGSVTSVTISDLEVPRSRRDRSE